MNPLFCLLQNHSYDSYIHCIYSVFLMKSVSRAQLNSPQHVACRTWPQDHQPLQQPPDSETITVETQKTLDTTYMLGTTPPMRPPPTTTLTTVSNRPKSHHISTLRTPQPTTVSGRGRCNPAAAAALAASRSQITQITRYIDFESLLLTLHAEIPPSSKLPPKDTVQAHEFFHS